jgi:predicted RND superfamily exporter protein
MVMILGRPYVWGDPEQTAEIKRMEKEAELRERILKSLNEAIDAVDSYVNEIRSDDSELKATVLTATRFLRHLTGVYFDEEIETHIAWNGIEPIEWGEKIVIEEDYE